MINKHQQGHNARKKGIISELVACLLLRLGGYEIIARNYRPQKGIGQNEIDVIAKIRNTICFIEIKYRKSKESAGYAISYKAKERIANTAKMYIAIHPEYDSYDVRFDALLMSPFSFPMHIKNAWSIDK